MITTKLIQRLKTDGIAKGLCKDWQDKFTNKLNLQDLINMYVQGIDFCINNDYPNLAFLRRTFKGLSEPYGVFIDQDNLFLRNQKNVVLNGSCLASLNYDGYSVSSLYLRHDSKANINISGNAVLTIDAFDDTKLSITASGPCKAIIHTRGKADLKIINKDQQPDIKIKQTHTNRY